MAAKEAVAPISNKAGLSKKGSMPDISGVPGEVCSLEDLALDFTRKPSRVSAYDALLMQLSEATDAAVTSGKPRPGLKFGDTRAKASVYQRARKKGFIISIAELKGVLYVRLDRYVADDLKESRREEIRKSLKLGPMSHFDLTTRIRASGDQSVQAADVQLILEQFHKSGEVIRQEGDKWAMNPRYKASSVA